jgi:hypothetical protein
MSPMQFRFFHQRSERMHFKKLVFCILAPIFLMLPAACRNSFLPPTGVPVDRVSDKMRATPQGVLNQLVESYENRQISLYKDLFPKDGSFRFFIAPADFESIGNKYGNIEKKDSRLKFIGTYDFYYYWTQDIEVESHTRLFSQALSIEFIIKPVVDEYYEFVDGSDVFMEVKITGGILKISRINGGIIEVWTTEITRQVFLLKKDEENLWVISKWYDFSTYKK